MCSKWEVLTTASQIQALKRRRTPSQGLTPFQLPRRRVLTALRRHWACRILKAMATDSVSGRLLEVNLLRTALLGLLLPGLLLPGGASLHLCFCRAFNFLSHTENAACCKELEAAKPCCSRKSSEPVREDGFAVRKCRGCGGCILLSAPEQPPFQLVTSELPWAKGLPAQVETLFAAIPPPTALRALPKHLPGPPPRVSRNLPLVI